MGFAKFGLNPKIKQALDEMGFSKPTPIQEQSLPLLMQGEDLIGQAQTGTGKTAAFGITILERLSAGQQQSAAMHQPAGASSHQQAGTASRQHDSQSSARHIPRALVLAPTRELAVQITGELHKIGKHMPLKTLAVYGGQEIEKQLSPLHAGVDVVVGTPGRLLDHIERGSLNLSQVDLVVLDEADRMLDMGFIEDIEKILQKTKQNRQTMLFSATMPPEILNLGKKYMNHPQNVSVSQDDMSVKSIRQYYIETSKFDRLNLLLALLQQKKPPLALIFVRTKRGADRVNEILLDRGFRSLALHGDMSQNKRDRSMDAFRKQHINILVATDLASRGLDVTGVTHVINYDLTDDPYTYLHRIGRTGRMGKDGEAISFVFFDQTSLISIIEKVTDSKMEQIKLEFKLEDLPRRVPGRPVQHSDREGGHGRFGRSGGFGHGGREGGRAGGRGEGRSRFGSREGGRDRRGRDRRSQGGEHSSKEVHSRGHQYFGRRN